MNLLYTRTGYIFLSFLLFTKLLYEASGKKEKHRLSDLILSIFILSFYFGMRPIEVGADTLSYYNYFIGQAEWMEIGFTFLNKLIFLLFPNFNFFLIIINFLMLTNLSIFYYSHSKSLLLTELMIIIFVFLPYGIQLNINVIRQGLALSFLFLIMGLNNLDYFNTLSNRLLKVVLYIISISIHKTMLVFVLMYEIIQFTSKRIKYLSVKKQFIIMLLTMLAISLNLPMLVVSIVPIDQIKNKLLHYMKDGYEVRLFLKILGYFLISIIYQESYRKIYSKDPDNEILRFYNFSVLVASLVSFSYTTSTRILVILDFMLPFFLVDLLKSQLISNSKSRILLSFVFTIYIILYSFYGGMISSFNW